MHEIRDTATCSIWSAKLHDGKLSTKIKYTNFLWRPPIDHHDDESTCCTDDRHWTQHVFPVDKTAYRTDARLSRDRPRKRSVAILLQRPFPNPPPPMDGKSRLRHKFNT